MTALYYPPKFDSGLPGAKLWFYQTNTTTPQNTYTDAALGVASSNPVVADADGVFAPIYLDPTLPNYRVKYTDSSDVLLYQVDDVPSNQGVQQFMRLQSTNPYVFWYDTDGTTNLRKYRARASGSAWEVQLANDAESVFTTILQYDASTGILKSNATEVAVTTSGSFTGTLTGMTTTTTGTVKYRKVNNIATLWLEASILGTSNTTAMSMTGIPATLTPAFGRVVTSASGANSGVEVGLANNINASNTIIFATLDASSTYVNPNGTFSNSGQKGLYNGWTITYAVA